MNEALHFIQELIAKTEKYLEQLRIAEKALTADRLPNNEPIKVRFVESKPTEAPKGVAAAIRGLLDEFGPLTKADIDTHLHDRFSLGEGTVSGALQSMKTRGMVARTKAGKWKMK